MKREAGGEQGFTLLELLVVMAIITLISSLLGLIIYQFLRIPRWGNDQMALDNDLRQAGWWLTQDGNESVAFIPAGACGSFDTGRGIFYDYTLNGTGLQRTDSSTGQAKEIARHVTGLTCTLSGDLVSIAVVVSKGSLSTTATFPIAMRAQE